MSRGVLLDTCAVIWGSQGNPFSKRAAEEIHEYRTAGLPICVSPLTAWEMALLLRRRRITESRPAKVWYDEFLQNGRIQEVPVTADVLMASCFLPDFAHKDPFDRALVATARERDLTIVTRDKAILAYGAAGHVHVLAC